MQEKRKKKMEKRGTRISSQKGQKWKLQNKPLTSTTLEAIIHGGITSSLAIGSNTVVVSSFRMMHLWSVEQALETAKQAALASATIGSNGSSLAVLHAL